MNILCMWKSLSVWKDIPIIIIFIPGLLKIFRNSNYKTHAFSLLSLICINFIYQWNLLYDFVLFLITMHIKCIYVCKLLITSLHQRRQNGRIKMNFSPPKNYKNKIVHAFSKILHKSAEIQYKYKTVTAQVQYIKGGIMYEFRESSRR